MIGSIRRCSDLSAAERGNMLALLADNFDGVDTEQFERELAEKDWAVFVENGDGRLLGFSTVALEQRAHEGEPIVCVYSGDTIHARVTVEAITPSKSKPDRGTVRFRYRTFNQNDAEVLSLTMDHVMARRKGSETS